MERLSVSTCSFGIILFLLLPLEEGYGSGEGPCGSHVEQLATVFPNKVKLKSQQEEAGGIGPWATRAIFDRGTYVAVTGADGNVRVWDSVSTRVIGDFLEGGSILAAGAQPGIFLVGD